MKAAFLILAFAAFFLLLGCTGPASETGKGCGIFGAPPKITGISPCGSEDAPAHVAAGAAAEYLWNASSCYGHFKFQLKNGTNWGDARNMFETDVKGNRYETLFPAAPGNYIWNVQGFDPGLDVPKTANYPPCYFKVE